MKEPLLIINPGATSTKIAVFDGTKEIWKETLRHNSDELKKLGKVADQLEYRYEQIVKTIPSELRTRWKAVVGRGGLLRPMEGGVFKVDESMLFDLRGARYGEHASNLGAFIAHRFAKMLGVPAYIVEPVTTDEFTYLARISGVPGIVRKCRAHGLNVKAVARRAAKQIEKKYLDSRFVVAHLGGGISIACLRDGKIMDVNDGLLGMGPFSPERAGALPLMGVIEFVRDKGVEKTIDIFSRESGFVGYFGTSNLEEVEKLIEAGNETARLVRDAMIYQIAKEIGACATALNGRIDGIIITGGLAHSKAFVAQMTTYISYLGKIFVMPGEEEMLALAEGAVRVLNGEEEIKTYGDGNEPTD